MTKMCHVQNARGTLVTVSWHKVLLPLILLRTTKAAVVNAQALKDCDDRCGNVSIPYPFGTRAGCFMNEDFLITYNRTHHNPPSAFLREGNIIVTDIWLSGELRVYSDFAQDCYNSSGQSTYNNDPWIRLSKFPISHTKNKFTAIGCDTHALIKGFRGTAYTTGCMSLCDTISDGVEGSCSGIGCCQTVIPKGVMDYRIDVM